MAAWLHQYHSLPLLEYFSSPPSPQTVAHFRPCLLPMAPWPYTLSCLLRLHLWAEVTCRAEEIDTELILGASAPNPCLRITIPWTKSK